ncbi:MAG: phosphate signaling complex protein PhoU [Lachnospiraceae bacterium]|nr:phosphate signaling complex protein PhoU [Lachnospiraceae bacterium]
MRETFERQLKQLNDEMIQMGNNIEEAIEMAVRALMELDREKAEKAIAFDEVIDAQEKKIESMCLNLLLQQHPVARDLRTVSSALKMITDMERIGDHAADISEITLLLADLPNVQKTELIRQMAKETIAMVIKSVEAFVEKNQEKAEAVIAQDDVVDDLFIQLKQEIIERIRKEPQGGEQVTDLLMIGKYFERIGDHATNIAEWVIYSVTGVH